VAAAVGQLQFLVVLGGAPKGFFGIQARGVGVGGLGGLALADQGHQGLGFFAGALPESRPGRLVASAAAAKAQQKRDGQREADGRSGQ